MGITPRLSPALIKELLASQELPRRSATLLPPEEAEKVLRYGGYVGSTIHHFESLARGMEHARQLIRRYEEEGRSLPSGLVIAADTLTGGKGRFQRVWHAPPGGIWLTLLLVNTLLPATSRLLSIAAGIACCEAINHHLPDARLKWVNDVHLAGRKLCGILIETMQGPVYGEEYLLVGVGINVNNTEFPPELDQLAGSIKQLTGQELDLDLFMARLLAKFTWNIGLLHYLEAEWLADGAGDEAEDLPDNLLIKRFRELSDTVGRRVRFGYDVQLRHQYEGVVLGIENDGGLRLRNLKDGREIIEHAGELVYLD